jgi:hypothetical protein
MDGGEENTDLDNTGHDDSGHDGWERAGRQLTA